MTETLTLAHAIAGHWRAGATGAVQCNPADPDDLAVQVPEASSSDIDDAVAAATRAADALVAMGIEARSDALARIGTRLMADGERLALLIARETGKTLRDARGEVARAARIFQFFAGETLRIVGERFASTRIGVMVEVAHVPLGVVGLITPWNFPIAIPAWKLAPALAFGNAVVWKPSEVSSATATELMRIVLDAGLPEGAVNLVLGTGESGRRLCAHPGVAGVSFTGSERAGADVRATVGARNGRAQLEMGGVNGLIVMADADLDLAVECVANSAYFAAGQRCTATSRLIVEAPVVDAFVARLRARVATLRIGDPRDPATDVGPLANPRQKMHVREQVAQVVREGAHALIGDVGRIDDADCFFPPLLFDASGGGTLVEREIFGPVAGLLTARDLDHALDILNGSRYGLSAGICTTSLAHAERFKAKARAGMLMVNLPTAGVDYHAPFGGVGASSSGHREQGRAARDFYTTIQTVYQHPG